MLSYEEGRAKAIPLEEIGLDIAAVRHRRYDDPSYQVMKRTMDIAAASLALIVLFPVFLIVSALVAITSGLPVVFRQGRIGLGGKEFHIYKFRTMVRNAEEILKSRPELMEEYRKCYKIQNDPRISKLGKFLRKTTIDELPQLLNVVRGEMSLVGPRPIVPKEIEKYGDAANVYLSMKPGCAGLWQCSGRSTTTYEERVAMDREYYDRASIRYDIGILFRTLLSVVRCRDAQ